MKVLVLCEDNKDSSFSSLLEIAFSDKCDIMFTRSNTKLLSKLEEHYSKYDWVFIVVDYTPTNIELIRTLSKLSEALDTYTRLTLIPVFSTEAFIVDILNHVTYKPLLSSYSSFGYTGSLSNYVGDKTVEKNFKVGVAGACDMYHYCFRNITKEGAKVKGLPEDAGDYYRRDCDCLVCLSSIKIKTLSLSEKARFCISLIPLLCGDTWDIFIKERKNYYVQMSNDLSALADVSFLCKQQKPPKEVLSVFGEQTLMDEMERNLRILAAKHP